MENTTENMHINIGALRVKVKQAETFMCNMVHNKCHTLVFITTKESTAVQHLFIKFVN